jgi:hypothetical protein
LAIIITTNLLRKEHRLRVFSNNLLRIFGPERQEARGD